LLLILCCIFGLQGFQHISPLERHYEYIFFMSKTRAKPTKFAASRKKSLAEFECDLALHKIAGFTAFS
jgi:hypothetical protein